MMDIESGGIGGAIGAAIAGAAVRIFGTRTERSDDRAQATAEWRELAEEAKSERRACEERARATEALVEEMRTRVNTIEGHYFALQAEHAECPQRIARLEQQVLSLERQSSPPDAAQQA